MNAIEVQGPTKEDEETKKYSYAALGMVFGMFIGSAIGVTAFSITKNAALLIFPMWGVFLGLVIRSLLDKRKRQ